jgi:MFS family permease
MVEDMSDIHFADTEKFTSTRETMSGNQTADMVRSSTIVADLSNMPPGTELMRNTTHHRMVESRKSHQILLPTPSNDLSDPLNWSWKWKLIVIFNQSLFVLFSILPSLSIAPATPIFMEEFHASEATVALFLGVCVITLGYANFFIVPFSNAFGRRAACLLFGVLIIGSNIWQATAKDTASFFGARALNGIATAVNETIMVQVIADVFFLHERGQWMGLYFASYNIGIFIGPIIAGNMAEYVGWRNFFWLCLAASIFNLISLLVLFPETKFHRNTGNTSDPQAQVGDVEQQSSESSEEKPFAALAAQQGQGKPSRSQWKLVQRPLPGLLSSLAADFVTPIYILIFPIVVWAVLVVTFAASSVLVVNLTESGIFGAPPYNFTPGNVGFVNFAMIVGGLLGLGTAGPLSDWVAKKMTARNNDLREPEMRLLAMIPYFCVMALGIIVVGLGYQNAWPWEAIAIFGFTCIGVQVIALPTIAITYAVDAYKPISGEILVITTVFKNTVGFGMSWWVPTLTPTQAVFTIFSLNASACLLGIPIYFFGKRLRGYTRNSKVHQMEAVM